MLTKLYPDNSIGSLMEPVVAVFKPETTVKQTTEMLREMIKGNFITYCFVVDANKKLVGVVAMRELLFAEDSTTLQSIIITNPFYLTPQTLVLDAMKDVVNKHFPEYPVCDDDGYLVGTVRGFKIFQNQAIEISAQAGAMVGVEKEERTTTHWFRAFKYRHPWLQLNLLTAFVAGAVVNFFQGTIDQLVILAAFLPVLAGQSGNTGCQALAVTLRGMTLGDIKTGQGSSLILKEALLGLMNGLLVGVSAGAGMYFLASSQNNPDALTLSLIVIGAMTGSCVISGVSGATVPQLLKKLGADPATASSIFLTTATDVASMGMLLGLATWILL
jgi:magnesium transporter